METESNDASSADQIVQLLTIQLSVNSETVRDVLALLKNPRVTAELCRLASIGIPATAIVAAARAIASDREYQRRMGDA